MCKNNKCNVFAIIGIVITVVSVLSVAAYFIYRYFNNRCLCEGDCYEFDCSDCDAEDCSDCPLTEGLDAAQDAE